MRHRLYPEVFMRCRQLTTITRSLLALLLVVPCLVQAQATTQGALQNKSAPIISAPPAQYRSNTTVKAAAAVLLLTDAASARHIDLTVPVAAEGAAMKAQNAVSGRRTKSANLRALAIGFGRAIPAGVSTIPLASLTWVPTSDGGRAARIEVRSPNATALRVAMRLPSTDPDLSVRFAGSAADATVFGPIPANAIAEDTERFGQFWSPVLSGDTATIEFQAAAGAELDGVTLTLTRVSHQVVPVGELPSPSIKTLSDIGRAQSCNIDYACVAPTATAALANSADAVAQLLFVGDDGGSYLCTGTLLNDSITSNTPYLFTAAHCMTSANTAHTLNTFWFFDSSSCNSGTVSPRYRELTGGAALLGRSQDHDWALVRLNEAPPAGTYLSAWRAQSLVVGDQTVTLHHPGGDLLKISYGAMTSVQFTDDGIVYGDFNEVFYSRGITEGGSSGSGLLTLFTPAQGNPYYELRGGISEGNELTCPVQPNTLFDDYTRVEDMLPLVRQYLTPDAANPTGEAVVVEFYNKTLNHYFISASPSDINDLDTGVFVGWERTGLRFLAYNNQAAGTNPVCRFYRSPAYGDSHFYSASPAECAATAARFPDWIYESPDVFYIQLPDQVTGACPANTQPIWRFYNQITVNHRYTAETVLRDQMLADPATWISEGYGADGVVMCAPTQ
jgi:lysyl endopeptidase